MRYNFTTSGVCSKKIIFDLEDGLIKYLKFIGGCPGNLLAISVLLKDKPAEKAAALLKGLPCGQNPTSCSDQLANALTMALEHEKNKGQKKESSSHETETSDDEPEQSEQQEAQEDEREDDQDQAAPKTE
jgi:uncharacterized protein (TIGR03905 family)